MWTEFWSQACIPRGKGGSYYLSLFGGHHSILPDLADIEGNYDGRERRSLWEFLGGNVQSASKSIAFEGAIASVLQIQKEAQIWVSCMVVKKKRLYIDFMTACISSKKSLVKL